MISIWMKRKGVANINKEKPQPILPTKDAVYGVSIYENGDIVDPTCDNRFNNTSWARENWIERPFLYQEVCQVLRDVSEIVNRVQHNG